jgi:tellurite resistance protein TerA
VIELMVGGNAPIPTASLSIRIETDKPVDISCFCLYATGKVKGDSDMVFYGQTTNTDGTVSLEQTGGYSVFDINLPHLSGDVQRIAFTATCDKGQIISSLNTLTIQVEQSNSILVKSSVDVSGRTEAALILGEVYRRNNEWKFRFISQGFNGGLKPLAEHFGVEVEDEPTVVPEVKPELKIEPVKPATPINLSKVSLTKEKPKVNLSKKDNFGLIRINLNWNQNTGEKGFLSGMFGSKKGVDLDLGAFVRLQDGNQFVIQALGNGFGSTDKEPFVQLQGDDRTGSVTTGEWLHVNGRHWKEIDEVLIYAFIYDGVSNWDSTDGIVTLHIPDQLPIESKLTEGRRGNGMCAIARLVNLNGSIEVERVNQYFAGHREMDQAFGWGFRWKSGSK